MRLRKRNKEEMEILRSPDASIVKNDLDRYDKKTLNKMIRENPELYIEVNIITKEHGIIKTDYVFAKDRKFEHTGSDGKTTTYQLQPSGLVLNPMKGSFLPAYYFKEGNSGPISFANKNKRVPGRIISLLYNFDTYRMLIQVEIKKLNLILVILNVATLITLFIYAWGNWGHWQIPKIF